MSERKNINVFPCNECIYLLIEQNIFLRFIRDNIFFYISFFLMNGIPDSGPGSRSRRKGNTWNGEHSFGRNCNRRDTLRGTYKKK